MDDAAPIAGSEMARGQAKPLVPGMPVIHPSERSANPYPVREGLGRTVGWQFRPQHRGGPVFVLLGRGPLGVQKVVERFPLTETGWAKMWRTLEKQDPQAAGKIRERLLERERERRKLDQWLGTVPEIAELDLRSLACLHQVTLVGGYAEDAAMVIGELYDARFLEDRFAMFAAYSWEPCAEVPYSQVEHVEIGGPGLVKTGGGFVGGGFGAVGALEGMAIASILNALTTRTSITTIIRIQGTACEFFLLHTRSTPEKLRIEMSRALGAIRTARAGTVQEALPAQPMSPVQELAKLAEMLQAGLLTREEFDRLKTRLLQA